MWCFFLDFRPFDSKILINSFNLRVWSPKSKAKWIFVNVVIWRKSISNVHTENFFWGSDFVILLWLKRSLYHGLLLYKKLFFSKLLNKLLWTLYKQVQKDFANTVSNFRQIQTILLEVFGYVSTLSIGILLIITYYFHK